MKGKDKNRSPRPSVTSQGSDETIKSRIFRELIDGGGRKSSKAEEVMVLPYGRGGCRVPKKAGSSQPHPVDVLIASASTGENTSRSNTNTQRECDELSTISATSSSKISIVSKATFKTALKQILGGGGNDEVSRKNQDFITPFGRGGAAPSHRRDSESDMSIRPLSVTSSVDSIGRNPDGLFFFGHANRPNSASDRQEVLHVGPGEGIFHPNGRPTGEGECHIVVPAAGPSKASVSMTKSGMSKISVKIAVKEVFGGGGNDRDKWKFVPVFHPSFGRGGGGARHHIKSSPTSPDASRNFKPFPRAGSSQGTRSSNEISNDQTSSPHHYAYTGQDSNWHEAEESEEGRAETGRPRSSSASRALTFNRVRFRERSSSDPAQAVNLMHLREQVQMEHTISNRKYPIAGAYASTSTAAYHPEDDWDGSQGLRSQESLCSLSTVSLSPSDAIDAIRIPPPPRMAPPLPPSSPPRATSPLLQPSPVLSTLVRRGSNPTTRSSRGPGYRPPPFPTQRHTSLPVMPSPSPSPIQDNAPAFYALPMAWHTPHSSQSTPRPSLPPLVIDNTNSISPAAPVSPSLSSPGFSSTHGIHYAHVDPNVIIQGLASLAHAQAQELQLAQAQRDVVALEREVLAAEREAFDAEIRAAAAKRASLEREKEAIAHERARLEEERRTLSQRVHGLKKEVNKKEQTIKGLTWLVGNLDGPGRPTNSSNPLAVSDESETDVSPPSDLEEESEPTDDDTGEQLSDIVQQVHM